MVQLEQPKSKSDLTRKLAHKRKKNPNQRGVVVAKMVQDLKVTTSKQRKINTKNKTKNSRQNNS